MANRLTAEELTYFKALTEKRTRKADLIDEDPGLRNIIAQAIDMYSDQAHFVYELIQNADDAGATEAEFAVREDRLVFSHNGTRRFSISNPDTETDDLGTARFGDINAITGSVTTKSTDNKEGNAIGKFGMGFLSVFNYTATPEIYDPRVAFKIERKMIPTLLDDDYPGRKPEETVFVFPFVSKGDVRPAFESLARLTSLIFPTLFLNNLQTIIFNGGSEVGEYRKRILEAREFGDSVNITSCKRIEYTQANQSGTATTQILLFSRKDKANHRYAIGFMLDENGHLIPANYKAFCFFPTKYETKLKFLIHAPFLLTSNREGIKDEDPHNIDMFDKLADLMYDSLLYMRDMRTSAGERLIDDSILNIIPIGGDQDDPYVFRVCCVRALKCFQTERILPTIDGYVVKENAYWPKTHEISSVFPDVTFQELYNAPDRHWVFCGKWNAPGLDSALRDFVSACTVECPSDVAILDKISPPFIKKQKLPWLSVFYKWIDGSDDRRKRAMELPIFLDHKGEAVAAFNSNGEHILFLPAVGSDTFTTIHEDICQDEYAMGLIARWKVETPSEDDRIGVIIDKISSCEGEASDALFKEIVEYYARRPQEKKEYLIKKLQGKVKLRGKGLRNNEIVYLSSSELYWPSDSTKEYFRAIMEFNGAFENVFVVDLAHYHELIEEALRRDFDRLLSKIGVMPEPSIRSEERTGRWEELENLLKLDKVKLAEPSRCHRAEQKFRFQYVHGASLFLKRLLAEKNMEVKRGFSRILWKIIKFHADQYLAQQIINKTISLESFLKVRSCFWKGAYGPNFLGGKHEYSNRGKQCEDFDSPQLFEFRGAKWIVLNDSTCVSPDSISVDRLPEEYVRRDDSDPLLKMLGIKPAEAPTTIRVAEDAVAIAMAEAEAREGLSENQKHTMKLGEEAERRGLTIEDLDECARIMAQLKQQRREKVEQSLGRIHYGGKVEGGLKEVSVSPNELSSIEQPHTVDVATSSSGICHDGSNIQGREQGRPDESSVVGRIESRVRNYKESFKRNVVPPPLPSLDDDEGEDDDELTPKAIDFAKRIRNREDQQAREIATLEKGEELQREASEVERYSLGWFKAMLELEMLGKEKEASSQREVSICFTKIEREPNTERTFILKRPSRNIPQWLEDVSDIPLDMVVAGKSIRPMIEVMNVQSFNLRVKLKADSKLEGVDLQKLDEARVVTQRPLFLMEELKRGLAYLPLPDEMNLRTALTNNIEFVFGPPGTGKTTFLAEKRIMPMMREARDWRVLVLAPTNKAADVLTSRIISRMEGDISYRKWLIRFGSTLDEHLDATGVCVGKEVDLKKYPRHVVITTIARFPYDSCITGNSAPQRLVDYEWDCIVVDEASMIPLANIIYPLYAKKNARFIIAGDPFQIEPIISCEEWKDENIYKMVGLKNFAAPKTEPHDYHVERLTTQYRSIPSIGTIFSRYRYGGILAHARSESSRRPLEIEGLPEIRPLTVLKFPVRSYESFYRPKRLGVNGGSSYQIYSALFAYEFVIALARKMKPQTDKFRIGVISPYRAQADLVQRLVERAKFPDYVEILAGTVHGFQGDECEMIVALFNPPPGISANKGSFINKKNIINVAVSRARDYLVILMPDDDTHNLENMVEVRKVEALMKQDAGHCIVHRTNELEECMFGNPNFIDENSFSTGHQSVNVYGAPEKRYEVRADETAVDIQIHEDAH